jgi:hypothetical protein
MNYSDTPKNKANTKSKTSKYYTPTSKTLSKSSAISSSTSSNSSKYYTPASGSSNHSDVYNSLSKETKTIIDEISKKPKIKKSSNLFITDKAIQKIQKFFKKYAVDEKYTLDNRVKYYKYKI